MTQKLDLTSRLCFEKKYPADFFAAASVTHDGSLFPMTPDRALR